MTYTGIKINVSESQKKKIQNSNSTDKVTLVFTYQDLMNRGDDEIYLTNTQLNKIKKAIDNKKGVRLDMSKTQLEYNIKHGGFLGALAGLASRALPMIASKVLPALGIGALTGAAQTGVSKLLGSGLYLKKGGCVCQIEPYGEGLILKPYNGRHNLTRDGFYNGEGLYLKKGDGLFDIFKSIPLLGSLF